MTRRSCLFSWVGLRLALTLCWVGVVGVSFHCVAWFVCWLFLNNLPVIRDGMITCGMAWSL